MLKKMDQSPRRRRCGEQPNSFYDLDSASGTVLTPTAPTARMQLRIPGSVVTIAAVVDRRARSKSVQGREWNGVIFDLEILICEGGLFVLRSGSERNICVCLSLHFRGKCNLRQLVGIIAYLREAKHKLLWQNLSTWVQHPPHRE